MAYRYYQTAYPGWGTSQFQFGSPPLPAFQPGPSWGGYDYYNAYAINPDRSLYYNVMNRLREFGATGGVGLHDARKWHRRIYSGLVNLGQALPADIGSAAAYEAYRTWRHHHTILYDPLGGGREREKEAMIGMAVAEATHLWQYSGRPFDTYGMQDALEAAALTASRISYRVMEDDRSYRGSRGSYSGYSGSGSDRYYSGSDRDSEYPSDNHRRHRRHSSYGNSQPIIIGGAPSAGYGIPSPYAGGGIPIPGVVNSGYNAGAGYAGSYPGGGYAGSYQGGGMLSGSYPGGGMLSGSYPGNGYQMPGAISNPYLAGGSPNPYGAAAYPGVSPYAGTQYLGAGGVGYSAGYPQSAGYAASYPMGTNAYPGQATSAGGATIIIPGSRRRHRSSSHSHHRHRSR